MVFISSFCTLLGACSLPTPQKAPNETSDTASTFVIADSSAQYTQTIFHKSISLPIEKTMSIKICLKDYKTSNSIPHQRFKVEDIYGERSLTTDRLGCMNWSQKISYNHLAPAAHIEFPIKISGTGRQRGQKTELLIINPWENLISRKENFSNSELVQKSDALKRLNQSQKRNLVLEELRLNVEEKLITTNGTKLSLEFRATPQIPVSKVDQPMTLEPLHFGDFNLELFLIHVVSTPEGDNRRLLSAPSQKTVSMINSSLFVHTEMELAKICTRGQVQLGLKLSAINGPNELEPFQGVFAISECENFKGSFFSRLKSFIPEQKGEFEIQDYLTNSKPISRDESEEFYENSKIEIKRLSFTNVGYRNHGTIERDRIFNVTACLKTGLDQKITRSQSFEVIKANGEKITIRSNNDGCLIWDDSFKFNYFERECWKERNVRIKNNNLGLDESLKLHINPWSQNETFVRDIRFVDKSSQNLICAQGKSQIITQRYDFDKKVIRYNLDRWLNIRMIKEGLFRLPLKLRRPSLTEPSGYSEELLPVGYYLLRYAIVDNAVKNFSSTKEQIYQVGEKVVYVNANSTVAETLTLESANIKAIGNTNQILIEIVPLKENAYNLLKENPRLKPIDLKVDSEALETSTFVGPIILANNTEGAALEPSPSPLSGRLIDQLSKSFNNDKASYTQRMHKMSEKSHYIKDSDALLFNLHDTKANERFRLLLNWPTYDLLHERGRENKFPLDNQILKNWIFTGKMSKDLANRFCAYYFFYHLRQKTEKAPRGIIPDYMTTSSHWTNACQIAVRRNELHKYFDIQYRYFVKNPKMVGFSSGSFKDITFSTAFAMNRGYQESLTKSLSWDVSAGIKLLDFKFVSASTGVRYSVQKSWANTNGSQASQVIQQGVSAVLEQLRVKIQADEYEKCAIITLNPSHYTGEKDWLLHGMAHTLTHEERARILMKPIAVCQGETQKRPISFQEDYYVLNQRINIAQVLDPNADMNRPFFTFIRGEHDMRGFLAYLHAQVRSPGAPNSQDNENAIVSEYLEEQFSQAAPSYPGQIVRPQ